MHDQHVDVMLISADDRLSDLIGKHRPETLRLRRASSPIAVESCPKTAAQLWFDLDANAAPPDIPVERRIYFYSQVDRRPDHLPPGVFVRKPCSASIIELLWAGVSESDRTQLLPSAEPAPADLPRWIDEFHLADLKELCRRCVRVLPARLGYSEASLYVYDSDDHLLTLAETNHERSIDLAVSLDRPRGPMMAEAARSRRLFCSDDALQAHDRDARRAPLGRPPYRDSACLVAPLTFEGELQGVLNLSGRAPQASASNIIDRQRLEAVFAFIARSIVHARLYQQARTEARVDGLTGLANYRAFREALERETRRSQRYGAPLTLAMLDLDGLKAVNDQYGHSAGDFLLRNMTSRITAALREFDFAARVGGDEFAIILPNTAIGGARHVATRMLERFRLDPPRYEDRLLAITGSCGLAQFSANESANRLVTAADEALYEAKRRGRNCLVCRPAQSDPLPTNTTNTSH